MEGLFAEDGAAELPMPESFKTFRPVCGAGVPSAGREGEDLEKLGIGSESTMLGVRWWALLHRRSARDR